MMEQPLGPRIGVVLSVVIVFEGCDPGYWVGVRVNLKEPISPECIENTLRKLPEVHRVTRHQSESPDVSDLSRSSTVNQSPDQYLFEAGDDKGVITQFQQENGRTSFLAGVNGMGPSQERMEDMQIFNARIAKQVVQACDAMLLGTPSFVCTPDRVRCREALREHASQ